MIGIDPEQARRLENPYCCLHYIYPNEDAVQKKLKRYALWGHSMIHPLENMYAPPELLPRWAL